MFNRKAMPIGRQGFTLIEMLVVIAIIGILSAAVLVALGPSRNKAKDARVISGLEQIRILWETQYNGSAGSYPDITSQISDSSSDIGRAAADIATNNGGNLPDTMGGGTPNGVIWAPLNIGGYFCVDTVGNSTEIAGPPSGTSCDTTP